MDGNMIITTDSSNLVTAEMYANGRPGNRS